MGGPKAFTQVTFNPWSEWQQGDISAQECIREKPPIVKILTGMSLAGIRKGPVRLQTAQRRGTQMNGESWGLEGKARYLLLSDNIALNLSTIQQHILSHNLCGPEFGNSLLGYLCLQVFYETGTVTSTEAGLGKHQPLSSLMLKLAVFSVDWKPDFSSVYWPDNSLRSLSCGSVHRASHSIGICFLCLRNTTER